MLTREFFQPKSGPCIFTVACPDGKHYTYRLTYKPASTDWPATTFVGLLTGPDNVSDYTYVGLLSPNGIRLTRKSAYTYDSFPVKLLSRVLARIFANDTGPITQSGYDVLHEGRCGHCGRPLTTPESIQIGIGPICLARMET